jgi:hypothetical protein
MAIELRAVVGARFACTIRTAATIGVAVGVRPTAV